MPNAYREESFVGFFPKEIGFCNHVLGIIMHIPITYVPNTSYDYSEYKPEIRTFCNTTY